MTPDVAKNSGGHGLVTTFEHSAGSATALQIVATVPGIANVTEPRPIAKRRLE